MISFDFTALAELATELRGEADSSPAKTTRAVARVTDWMRSASVASAPRGTGALAGSVTGSVSGIVGRVGSPLRQGFFQEVGTSVMTAQPWLWTHNAQAEAMLEAELDRIGWRP